MRHGGLSLRQIAAAMASQGVRTPRGGAWTAASVANVLNRMGKPRHNQIRPEAASVREWTAI